MWGFEGMSLKDDLKFSLVFIFIFGGSHENGEV